ncbi:MAG: hypothetical protein ACI87N_001084 [Flavobacteriales bacterium]|jgi:hypothetical protein
MNINKDAILAKINSHEILDFYLRRYHNYGKLLGGQNISNPLLTSKQETPSFNIFPCMKTGDWLFHDFATDDKGSCFDLVMKLFNLSFPEALARINTDFMLMLDSESITPRPKIKKEAVIRKYEVKRKPFNKKELDFWLKYGIDESVLKRFEVTCLEEYKTTGKTGNPYTVNCHPEGHIFAYENDNWIKIYKPLSDKNFKFQYLGSKETDFIFGLKQLPQDGETLFITGGEKDVISLSAKGFSAICLNSETANLELIMANLLKSRFNNIVVLYDSDETGIKHSEILAKTNGYLQMVLPPMPNDNKDISDYFSLGNTLESFNKLLEEVILNKAPKVYDFNKVTYNAVELLSIGSVEPKYLMRPIFPQKGTAVLAGKPDTGKSQLARQLCIQVALGERTFLGFELNLINNRAIYVATEDNQEATTFLVSKQFKGLQKEAVENLRFMFADTMDQEEILTKLDAELRLSPADLVVVDSFGDVFKGGDSNNNMAMRNTVKLFDKIAKDHNCLILFVHHINKAAYKQAPGQEHIQGGSGLLQKVRLAIQLSEGDNNKRYFTVVKGNYCPKEFKQNSLTLSFSEETFLFTNTGVMIATSEIGTQPDNFKKEEKLNELEEFATTIFSNKTVSYTDFSQAYSELTGKSIATAKRVHAQLLKLGKITKCNGAYRLTNLPDSYFKDKEDDSELPY